VPGHVALAQPVLTADTAVVSVACPGLNLSLLGFPTAAPEPSRRLLPHSALPWVLSALPWVLCSAQISKLSAIREGKKTQSHLLHFEFVLGADKTVAYLISRSAPGGGR